MTAREDHDYAEAAWQRAKWEFPWIVRWLLGGRDRTFFKLGYRYAELERSEAELATTQSLLKVYEELPHP